MLLLWGGFKLEARERDPRRPREPRLRGRILAYTAPPPSFVRAAPLHHRSALIIGEMGSGKTTFIEAKLGEAVRLLLEEYGVDDVQVCYLYGREAGVQKLLEAARYPVGVGMEGGR